MALLQLLKILIVKTKVKKKIISICCFWLLLTSSFLLSCSFASCSTKTVPLTGNTIPPVDEPAGLVKSVKAFNEAVKKAQPGDEIILANGVWKDVELKFSGNGTKEKPIILTVEEKGKVFLEGQSNLRMGGTYLHVEGLVFRNGHTPSGAVIALRRNKETLCHNCRVTECVIDDYNPPERFDRDYWIEIYGKHNRVDHNYLVGKRNKGVTLAVRLTTEESRANNHRIDHNHFGYRPTLGANGGETLRIGTSHHSLTNSNTLVEDNYFEHCNGELEIISNKSCQNTFVNNSFFECQGTLTMRHGNETLVEHNYFIGNGKVNTGGIRVINERQTVNNNYCQGLTGYRFRGALVVMNGVPNSPKNRYFQVKDSKVSNNLIVDCDHIQLCAGSDEERSAVPVNSEVTNNIIYNTQKDKLFTVYDDISGIRFDDNILSENIQPPKNNGVKVEEGFIKQKLEWTEKDGLIRSATHPLIGPTINRPRPNETNTGVDWYTKKDYQVGFGYGEVILVESGTNTLLNAIEKSNPGDIIQLTESANYHSTKAIDIPHQISILAAENLTQKPVLTFTKFSLFNIENGGSLQLQGLKVSGAACEAFAGNTVIRTSRYSMIDNYKLFIKNCDFENLDANHGFNVFKAYKNTFADSIVLSNCSFSNVSGHVLQLNAEVDDAGIYNAENVVLKNCKFQQVGAAALDLYRGGKDESTFGPVLNVSNCNFDRVGMDKKNKKEASINIHGVQVALFQNNEFKDCQPVRQHLIVGAPVIKYQDCHFTNSGEIISNDNAYEKVNTTFE